MSLSETVRPDDPRDIGVAPDDLGPDRIRECLAAASVPTLLMCLVHLTGDERFLQPPFLPRRDTNLFAAESGGLPPEVQEMVRKEAATELERLFATGDGPRVTAPDTDLMIRMMSVLVAEDVPAEYAPMVREELQFVDRAVQWTGERPAAAEGFKVLVIGAGLAGVAASIRLTQLGIEHRVVERLPGLGGTWFQNEYPEAGVDTPNHFYSYSFAPNTEWTGYFSKQPEVLEYCRRVAERYDVTRNIQFGAEVTSVEWSGAERRYAVTIRADGTETTEWANVVVSATGQLNRPKLSVPKDVERFGGDWFHSALWRTDVDLVGKRVAVVGTGASSMQLLRTVAAEAASVTVYQRSPHWVRPNSDYHRTVSPEVRWLMRNVPYYQAWYRFGLLWRFGDGLLGSLRKDPTWAHADRSVNAHNDRHRQQLVEYLQEQLGDRPDLYAACLPHYPPYGKRMLIDNEWFAALKRPNVELVTEAVTYADETGLFSAGGVHREFDVIVLGTGFEAGEMLHPIDVVGRDGVHLHDRWGRNDPSAYLGIAVPSFPNLFVLYGPNTNLAHGGSVIFQVEAQVRYLTSCLVQMLERGIDTVECREDVHERYNESLEQEHEQLVWTHPGMTNWYRNEKGRVFALSPWRLVDYWSMTHDGNLDDYVVTSG